jgi:hypothetical protein
MKPLKEFLLVCSLPPFRRRLAESAGVGYRTEAERRGPRCNANVVAALHRAFCLVAVSAFYDDHDIPAT